MVVGASRHVAGVAACVLALTGAVVLDTAFGAAPSHAAAVPAAPYDFNGDGRRDLAVGSPDASVAAKAGAGLVSVVFSGTAGPDTAKRRIITQYGPAVPGEPEAGDRFGADLASADLDRDGYADLIIGVPGEDTANGPEAGMVAFAMGSPTGFSDFYGAESFNGWARERYAESLTTGDLDGDGYPEAIASAPGSGWLYWWTFAPPEGGAATSAKPRGKGVAHPRTGVGAQAAGAEYFKVAAGDMFGDARAEMVTLWRDVDGGTGEVAMMYLDGAGSSWTSAVFTTGHTLAVGNLDTDARPEVVVGQYSDSGHRGGQVTVWQPGSAPTYLTGARRINQDTSGIPGTGETGDRFGQSLAIGDADNDGRGDLAVGVPGEDLNGRADAGAVVFLYGGTTTRTWAINQETTNVPGGSERGDRFGGAVSVLDLNADGRSELSVGSPGENGTEGLVTLLRGGLTSVGARAFGPQALGVTTTARLGSVLGH